jgi:hypothetical protein
MVENKITSAQNTGDKTETIVVMVSVGDRTRLTNYTYPRLALWASLHGYSCMLIKKSITDPSVAPHFNKLIAHRLAPGFKRYIIVDDDILLKKDAPPMQEVPDGFVGLSEDAVQSNTPAAHVKWTGNTGFIVADGDALELLEEAYQNGEYPYNCWDGSDKGIWGPHDQASLNNVLFNQNRIYKLDWRWNYQAVICYYATKDDGWEKWRDSRLYRIWYYISLLSPLSNSRKLVNKCYGIHMTMGSYPAFFSRIHK